MKLWRKLTVWLMLGMPASYYIGSLFNYTVYALFAAIGYLMVSVYLLFWEELPPLKNNPKEEGKE